MNRQWSFLVCTLALAALGAAAENGFCADQSRYTIEELNAFGRALAAEKCSRPIEVKTNFVRSPGNAAAADEMQSFDCRTFEVAVYRSLATSPARELPMSVLLIGAHPRAGPWAVGARAADIRAVLGPPARVFGENLVYSLSPTRDVRDTLTFEVNAGVVQALNWNWETD